MNRNGLIALQVAGGLSILPYPFVLLANIMSIAAPGHNAVNAIPWVVLSFYPLIWIALYVLSWRAMAHGSVGLAFGMSSIPVLVCLLFLALYVYSWIAFGLGTAGIGNGGLHVQTNPEHNVLIDSITLAGQDIVLPPGSAAAVAKATHDIDANPALINVSVPLRGSPLNVALGSLSVSLDGAIAGDRQRQQERIGLVRDLVAHGGHLNASEATDLHKTWLLRRALYDGPVITSTENPLVWRIVTHNRGEQKPFDPLRDPIPTRSNVPTPFVVRAQEVPLLNRTTQLHGTPLYAALLDQANDVCGVLIEAGSRLSAVEERDPAAEAALQSLFERYPALRSAYAKAAQ